jgi:hypothetical protein
MLVNLYRPHLATPMWSSPLKDVVHVGGRNHEPEEEDKLMRTNNQIERSLAQYIWDSLLFLSLE